jgi:hypothetical protein
MTGCGLVSCENVLRQFGVEVSEADVVRHAVQKGICNLAEDPAKSGGTSADRRVEILRDFGVSAHLELGGDVRRHLLYCALSNVDVPVEVSGRRDELLDLLR